MQIGVTDDEQIWKVVINPKGQRTVAFVAGLHGNEPGGPVGVLEFLRQKFYVPKDKKVIIVPLANPTGFKNKDRKTKDGEDLNRRYLTNHLKGEERNAVWKALEDEDLSLLHTLHEAPGIGAFFIYYSHHRQIVEDIVTLAKKYFPIHPTEKAASGDMIRDGIAHPPHKRMGSLEDKLLLYGVPYITSETPGKTALWKRTKFTAEMMKLVVHSF